jgi:hypothetical protein
VLASAAIGCRFTGTFSRDARRIRGLDEALEKYRSSQGRPYPPEDEREECRWLLESVGEGEFVLVFGMRHDMDRPMSPVLRWRTERCPEGMRPPMRGYLSPWPGGIPPDGRWIADPGLFWGLRCRIEACLEEGRRDKALHRGVPEKFWWSLLLQGYQRRGGGREGGHDSTPVKRTVGRGGEDKVVSLDEPDPGFVKAGLFGPSPPRMSDKAFEAGLPMQGRLWPRRDASGLCR